MNQVLNEMRKTSAKMATLIAVLLMFLGLMFFAIKASGLIQMIGGATELNEIEKAYDLPGSYVKYETNYVLDYFAEYDDESGRYYITTYADEYYIGVYVDKKKCDQMDAVCDDTWAFLTGEGEDKERTCSLKGTVRHMDYDERKYYREWFESMEFSDDEYAELTLEYVIMDGYCSDFDGEDTRPVTVIIVCLLGAAVFIIGVYILVKGLTGGFLKKVKKDFAQYGAMGDSQIEADYENAYVIKKKLRIGRLFTYDGRSLVPRAYLNSDIIWAYQHRTKNYTNGIYTGSNYRVRLYQLSNSGEVGELSANKKLCEQILEYYDKNFPHMVVGYSDELSSLYARDRNEFLSLRYYPAQNDMYRQDGAYEQTADNTADTNPETF